MNIPKPLKTEPSVQGFKYLKLLGTLLTDLHEAGAQRDRAGNRELFYDQYALLFLLHYDNPTISSLRGLHRLTDLTKVRHLGIHRTSLGSLSEAQHVFDAALLEKVSAELAGRLPTQKPKPGQVALLPLVAVDGSEKHVILVTHRLDLTAELMPVAYRYRWSVELFFRWLKCVLSFHHWLCQSENGVTFQVYSAMIASLLLSLWIGRSPNKVTYEIVCHDLSGRATEQELFAYLERSRLTCEKNGWKTF